MAYTAKHHIDHNQRAYMPGDVVRFEPAEIAAYEDDHSGPIAELLAAGAIEGEAPRLNLPIAEQSDEQLMAIATALGLELAVPIDRNALLAAIADARARLATPPASYTPPLPPVSTTVMTAEGPKSTPSEPGYVALSTDLGTARLAEIASAEGVSFTADAGADVIVAAIEARRAGVALPELRANLTRAQLADIATAEGAEFADNATRADIVAAIETKRAAA